MTPLNVEQLKQLQAEAIASLHEVKDPESAEAWRVQFLGRKGAFPSLLRTIKDLPPNQKKQLGSLGNQIRHDLETDYQKLIDRLTATSQNSSSASGRNAISNQVESGHLHPLTQTTRRLMSIFTELGFQMVEGPEVEDPYYDFDALNIPPEHPSRAESDSFYLKTGNVLRTSTSSVQVRKVKELALKPPFKIFSPGRVFRSEKLDPTHSHTFHQVEALVISQDTTIADYKSVTEHLFSRFFADEVKVRLRPGYFPFVEPGFEPDISCVFCQQQGCRICQSTGWIEVGGAGMVHPVVLKNMDLDPAIYQGFAFGYGLERLTMLRHGINDIRHFWSGDLNFLRQF